MDWLQQRMRTYMVGPDSTNAEENIVEFRRASPATGEPAWAAVVDLVHRAAELMRSLENHSAEMQARAETLATSALQELKQAEIRNESLETELRAADAVVNRANARLQE